MKILAFCFAIILLTSGASFGGINDELVTLFSARHAAAMVPAKEARIDDIDPWMGDKASGMTFNPKEAFSLEEGSFEKAVIAAKIEAWTFGMAAPWTPGKRSSWVVLDSGGEPFLTIRLIEDQPDVVLVHQVIGFAEGVATLGRAQHRFFRCELTSKDLVHFLKTIARNRSEVKFLPKVKKSK